LANLLQSFLTREAPDIQLRLATSGDKKHASLTQQAFPSAEVVQARYNDAASLAKAVEGMERIFVIKPPNFRERPGMTALVATL
jgi:uncharacterized protein YbjT (DUF2867 family)